MTNATARYHAKHLYDLALRRGVYSTPLGTVHWHDGLCVIYVATEWVVFMRPSGGVARAERVRP